MIVRYPNRADILVVGQVIDRPNEKPLLTGWLMKLYSGVWITDGKMGGWSVEELQKIEEEYRRGSISG